MKPVTLIRLIKLAIVLVVGATALFMVPGVRLFAWGIVTRSPACSFSQAVASYGQARRYGQTRERIQAASRLIQRDAAGFHLWDTPKGPVWIPADSDWLVAHLLAEQELNAYGEGELGAGPGDTVLDCGAHVGIYTRELLARGASLVVAVEPAPENLECLRRNLANEITAGRVIVYPGGVWDREAQLTLLQVPGNSAYDTFGPAPAGAPRGPTVSLTTIDKLVRDLALERVDFIKMDIEGAERRALAGARQTLRSQRPRLAIAAYHLPDDPEKIPAVVFQAWPGYTMQCGPCGQTTGGIRPEVLFFYWAANRRPDGAVGSLVLLPGEARVVPGPRTGRP